MSSTKVTAGRGRAIGDYFEPDEAGGDAKLQRQLRGHLEEIDYAAYAANRQIIGGAIGNADKAQFERLGLAAAQARARWIATALAMTESAQPASPEQIEKLRQSRLAFEELTEVYDALRRTVERGYLTYTTSQTQKR
jgi:hypothetical protein